MINLVLVLASIPVVLTQGPAGSEFSGFDLKNIPKADKWVKWCAPSQAELEKCHTLSEKLKSNIMKFSSIGDQPVFTCVKGVDSYDCMWKIEQGLADLMTMDSGQGYFAGRYHNLVPIMAEHYTDDLNDPPQFYAVAVVKRDKQIYLDNLKGIRTCHPAIGDSAGWVYPMGELFRQKYFNVSICNSPVQSVNEYFHQMCLPGAINSFYNTFGNNPVAACEQCKGDVREHWCSSGDEYAGYDGAFRCLVAGKGDIAFIRHDTIEKLNYGTNNFTNDLDNYQLLCPNNEKKERNEFKDCNWGISQSQIVMTSGVKIDNVVKMYKKFLSTLVHFFGPRGTHRTQFELFNSHTINMRLESKKYYKANLMFNDATRNLVDVGNRNTYYTWVEPEFLRRLEHINYCSQSKVRWCVISLEEKAKCEEMLMAFRAKELKPDLDCIYAGSTNDCMRAIRFDDADLMTLDAADVYYAGKVYGLVPIAKEDYGDMSGTFHVVAVTHKTDPGLSLFNFKGRRTCHGAVRTADGFVLPAHMLIETTQIRPSGCSLYRNMGELFAQSCIPGVLEAEYNSDQKPINLCESCSSGAFRKCKRNSDELYYGSTGAFRCLVENAGDVAFTRHLTVHSNTDGRNQAIWSRNRRSDDYELMCKDGRRLPVGAWEQCSLGVVPGNAVVTAAHKDKDVRAIYLSLLYYAQSYFSSDRSNREQTTFSMFDSGIIYNDLLFSDGSVRLIPIDFANQTYEHYLGVEFKYAMESLSRLTCDVRDDDIRKFHPSFATHTTPSLIILISLVCSFITLLQ